MEEEAEQTSGKRKRTPPVAQGGRERSRRKTIKLDPIEKLPYHLLQSILGRLPPDAAARAAAVCKKWYQIWKTSSNLDLDELLLLKKTFPAGRKNFLRSMEVALKNHDMEHLQDLRIWTMFYDERDTKLRSLGEQIVASAFQRGKIRVVDLNFWVKSLYTPENLCFHLPNAFFSRGTYLIRVRLEACLFPTCDVTNFRRLEKLILFRVYISDEMLSKVISNSPVMEYLSLTDCPNLQYINYSSSKLKTLLIHRCNQLIRVVLDVPYLVFFSYNGNFLVDKNCRFDFLHFVAPCLNLVTTVKISEVNVRAYHFTNLIAKFKNLENLHLTNCNFEEPPRILIPSLKFLNVHRCRNHKDMVITTPDLEHFQLTPAKSGFRVKRTMVFASLKTLFLGPGVFLCNKVFQVVIKGMELLQSLELSGCRGFKQINVENMSLKTLIVDGCCNIVEGDIFAPNLVSFKYVGHVLFLHRIAASADLHAHLDLSQDKVRSKFYSGEHYDRVITLLEKFNPNCRDLTLVFNDSELHMPLSMISRIFPIESLRNLNVTYKFDNKSFLCLISTALVIARCQEELCIRKGQCSVHMKFGNGDERGVVRRSHKCLRDHLSEITMKKFGGGDEEMEVVEYLLRKAANLKTMHISLLNTHLEADRRQIISTIRRYKRIAKNSTVQIH